MKSTIFWDITPCSPLKANWRIIGTYCLLLQGWRINRARYQRKIRRQAERYVPPKRLLTFNALHGVVSHIIIVLGRTHCLSADYSFIKSLQRRRIYNYWLLHNNPYTACACACACDLSQEQISSDSSVIAITLKQTKNIMQSPFCHFGF
jgi:hypothetical protein